MSGTLIALGVFRDIYVYYLGTGTLLKDLRHITLDAEYCLPAWYSSLLMFASAVFCFAFWNIEKGARQNAHARAWLVLAIVFILMSADEASGFHEVLSAPLREKYSLSGILHFSWVIAGGIGVAALGAYFLRFLLALPRHTSYLFVLAGTVYVAGALGGELIGGYFVSSGGFESPYYIAAALAEEALEIIGLTIFLSALILYRPRTAKAHQGSS